MTGQSLDLVLRSGIANLKCLQGFLWDNRSDGVFGQPEKAYLCESAGLTQCQLIVGKVECNQIWNSNKVTYLEFYVKSSNFEVVRPNKIYLQSYLAWESPIQGLRWKQKEPVKVWVRKLPLGECPQQLRTLVRRVVPFQLWSPVFLSSHTSGWEVTQGTRAGVHPEWR